MGRYHPPASVVNCLQLEGERGRGKGRGGEGRGRGGKGREKEGKGETMGQDT